MPRRTHEGKSRRGVVAGLDLEAGKIDGAPVDSRRSAGLQSADREFEFAQPRPERLRRRVAGAPRFVVRQPDVNESREESACRQDDCVGRELDPELGNDAADAVAFSIKSSTAC